MHKSGSKNSVCTFGGSLTVLNSTDLFSFADKGTGEVKGVIDELQCKFPSHKLVGK